MKIILSLFLFIGVMATACRKTSVERAPAADTTSSKLMILQPSPHMGLLDFYSVYTDTAKVNPQPVGYPGLTQYCRTPSGTRWVFAMEAGTYAQYWNYPFYFKPGGHYTMYNIQLIQAARINYAFVEDDLSEPPAGCAKIRWLQGRSTFYPDEDGPFSWIIHGGDTLARNIGYRSSYIRTDPRYTPDSTGFKVLPSGSYLFEIKNTAAPYTFQTSIQATLQVGGIYTLFTYGVSKPDSTLRTGVLLIQNK